MKHATVARRYVAICHPLKMHAWNGSRMHILVAIAWFLAFTFALPQLVIFSYRSITMTDPDTSPANGTLLSEGFLGQVTAQPANDEVVQEVIYECLHKFEASKTCGLFSSRFCFNCTWRVMKLNSVL